MTEERFKLSDEKYSEVIFDDDNAMGCIDVVETLNELHEENQELKQEVLFWRNLAEHRKIKK